MIYELVPVFPQQQMSGRIEKRPVDQSTISDLKYERLYEGSVAPNDFRSPGQLDYDRILHSSAFMRLGGISQVAHAEDATVVHNRLTHSMKVANLGAGLARRLWYLQRPIAASIGGPDPDIVAAAGLGHDLGHPPFGHVAERILQQEVERETKRKDGFEGNAQSFRVVTKTSIRKPDFSGLNLCRATLAGMLKYPWMCEEHSGASVKKWGAYGTEMKEFNFARKGLKPYQLTVEAEIMDVADDIAYSTHDLEDYYRAGLIPLDRLLNNQNEQHRFIEKATINWDQTRKKNAERYFEQMVRSSADGTGPLGKPYEGVRKQRAAARTFASDLISRFFDGVELASPTNKNKPFLSIDEQVRTEIDLLKEVIWFYVLPHYGIAAEEYGQEQVIRGLFVVYWEECQKPDSKHRLLHPRHLELLNAINSKSWSDSSKAQEARCRLVVDIISEMTEHQAVHTCLKLRGHPSRSLLDLVRR